MPSEPVARHHHSAGSEATSAALATTPAAINAAAIREGLRSSRSGGGFFICRHWARRVSQRQSAERSTRSFWELPEDSVVDCEGFPSPLPLSRWERGSDSSSAPPLL